MKRDDDIPPFTFHYSLYFELLTEDISQRVNLCEFSLFCQNLALFTRINPDFVDNLRTVISQQLFIASSWLSNPPSVATLMMPTFLPEGNFSGQA